MSALLDLAGLGLNPDRVRRLLAAGGEAIDGEVGGRVSPPLPDGVSFVTGSALPVRLAALPDAPPWLFVKGSLPDVASVAVVGSRRATAYGLELAREIGRRVGAAGWPVVSGLALGIDAAAHEGCLAAGGTAVAVLGSGIDVWYPRTNRRLGERILETGGAVVSEFGPGIGPEPWRFPFRNRIISGLSTVVVVVEAAVRSGALITAHVAAAQGREVMAVPGDITRVTSAGCNLLIRDGAHPIASLDDVVETIEFWLGPAPNHTTEPEVVDGLGVLPASLDELVERTGAAPGELMMRLVTLQAAGQIVLEAGMVRAP